MSSNLSTRIDGCQHPHETKTLDKYTMVKRATIKAAISTQPQDFKTARKMHECSNIIQRHEFEHAKKWIAFRCSVRFCPACEMYNTLNRTSRLLGVLPQFPTPKYRWLFLTLTARNCETSNLGTYTTRLLKAWHSMRVPNIKGVVGYIRHFEITQSKDGKAHPHIHALLLTTADYSTKGYLTQREWQLRWRRGLKVKYFPIVDVREVKGDPIKGILETVKYSLKPADMQGTFAALIRPQLRGRRLFSVGGEINLALRKQKQDGIDYGEFIDFYQWNWKHNEYSDADFLKNKDEGRKRLERLLNIAKKTTRGSEASA